MESKQDNTKTNGPSTTGSVTTELLDSKRLQGIDETKVGDLTRHSPEKNELLPTPQTFEVDDTASHSELTPFPKEYERRLKNGFGLWLDTKGVNDDGAYKVSGSFAIISVFVLVAVGLLTVKYLDGKLPEALQMKDIPNHPNSFIEERARTDLHHLTSVGVRVSGSRETDNITVGNILSILNDIRSNVLTPETYMEYEVQKPTGAFFWGSDEGQTSCYSKIANVVVKMQPTSRQLATNDSILVNCHFDTKPGSPGATDNMISCVTMLEIIRVFAGEQPTPLRNPIIFLFNGAEELGLQGAHGFVKGYENVLGNPGKTDEGHRWAKDVKTFINLEGAGGGGREILFQTGPGNSWTLEAYAKAAPYPYGVVIAEEAFQFRLIPSDTDFRVFRDYGDLTGLDMAFIKNGWVYHTKWDRDSEIPAGSMQHMGANTLAILRRFSGKVDFSELDMNSNGKMIYFDVLGLFMIFYPRWAGILIDIIVAVGTIAAIAVHIMQEPRQKRDLILILIWLPISAIISWIIGIGVAALVAVFLNGCGYYKPFYSYPTLAIVIFGFPAAISQVVVHAYTQNGSPLQTWMAQKLGLAVILLVMTFVTRAVFILSINLLFSVIAWHLVRYLCRGWPRAITLSYLITGELVPFLMSSYLLVTLSDVFVPILGRSGSETNANLFFGVIVAGLVTLLIWNGFAFIFVQFRKRILWTCLLAAFFVVNTVLVFGFVGKVPYQEKTPMRLNIVNVDRTWYRPDGETVIKSEAGYWFWPYDSNTKDFFPMMEKFVPELEHVEHVSVDYENCESLYCAQPFLWTMVKSIKTTHWLPHNNSVPIPLKTPVALTTTVTTRAGGSRRKVDFSIDAPTQFSLVLSPGPNYKLVEWTLTDSIPKSGTPWKGRDTYFIYHGRGIDQQTIKFYCDFELDGRAEATENETVVTVQYSAFYLYGSELMTSEFQDLVQRLPAWAYTMPWTAVLKMYDIIAQ